MIISFFDAAYSLRIRLVIIRCVSVLLAAFSCIVISCTPEETGSSGNEWQGGGKDNTVHVTGISLDRPSATIKEGESISLVVTITPDNAENKSVTWSSSSDAVATVDNTGKVTGVKAGSTTITATTEDGGLKATCALSVEANLAPSVTVEANHVSAISAVLAGKANLGSTVAADLQVGFQYSTSAGILPSNSTTIEATDADASYNYTTPITGLEPATKYYFRSFVRQNGQDTYGETKEFTTKDVASLLETQEASGVEAAKATLNAKIDLTNVQYKSLSYGFLWGTSESALNTDFKCTEISENAISATLTNLSHKTQYWYRAYVKLDSQTFYGEVKTFTTDVVPVESVSIDKTEYTFHTIGSTLTLNATVLPSDATDKSVEWSSDKEDVATVTTSGVVTAKGNGTATITVKTKDQEKSATCEITVAQWVTSVTLNSPSLTLNEGQEQTLIATVNPTNADDPSLTWTSSDENIAKVDQTGNVTAVSKGTATIKAEAKDGSGKYASCSVTVKRLVSSIQLNKTSLVLFRGTSNVSETLTASVIPSDASNTAVTWTSSNTSVATVSSSGVVTGKSRGTATITVTANDGNGAQVSCEVEVRQYVTSISLDNAFLLLMIGAEATLSVTNVQPDNANDKSYIWSSSDSSIASVDNSGKVTARANGNATIKATANDGSGVSASCSVIVFAEKVDMGIKTSDGKTLYWSTRNLCESGFVNSPEEYGDYYAWGEIDPYYSSQDPLTWKDGKTGYNWASYKWCNGSYSFLTKYNTTKYNTSSSYGIVDDKTVLEPSDDVASVKLGGKWRMPTDAEWTELRTKCTWTWTTNYNGTGVKGRIVTAPNGNSIFLPAAGYRNATSLLKAGSYGYYWSSSLNTGYTGGAWLVDFNSGGVRRDDGFRCSGRSVRPVSE